MYQYSFKQATIYEKEARDMLLKENETEEIKNLITSLSYNPVQTYQERFEYIKKARKFGNLRYFKVIAQIIADEYSYSVADDPDMEFACVYYGSEMYDFEFIFSLSVYYKRNPMLFNGHLDVIRKLFDANHREEAKAFWLKITR